jgi:hypothetical protein
MKLSTIQKIGGISIIVGSLLLTSWTILYVTILPIDKIQIDFSILISNPNWHWIITLAFLATLLMIFGFTAVYSRIYDSAGIVGFIGYIFIVLAYIVQTALTTWELFLYPIIVRNEKSVFLIQDKIILFSSEFKTYRMILEISVFLGVLLFCLALIRNKMFPKISGYLLFFGSIIYAISQLFNIYVEIGGILLLSAGCFIIGYRLISTKI